MGCVHKDDGPTQSEKHAHFFQAGKSTNMGGHFKLNQITAYLYAIYSTVDLG